MTPVGLSLYIIHFGYGVLNTWCVPEPIMFKYEACLNRLLLLHSRTIPRDLLICCSFLIKTCICGYFHDTNCYDQHALKNPDSVFLPALLFMSIRHQTNRVTYKIKIRRSSEEVQKLKHWNTQNNEKCSARTCVSVWAMGWKIIIHMLQSKIPQRNSISCRCTLIWFYKMMHHENKYWGA
mgnify:CR=1 FL=1